VLPADPVAPSVVQASLAKSWSAWMSLFMITIPFVAMRSLRAAVLIGLKTMYVSAVSVWQKRRSHSAGLGSSSR
jgi:hypothetical protein